MCFQAIDLGAASSFFIGTGVYLCFFAVLLESLLVLRFIVKILAKRFWPAQSPELSVEII